MAAKRFIALSLLAFLLIVPMCIPMFAKAADLPQRSVTIANPQGSATTSYTFAFNTINSYSLGSVLFEFCEETPIPNTLPCTNPTGGTVAGATLQNQTGITGFAIVPAGMAANQIVIGRAPSVQFPNAISFTFDNIVNPSNASRTYYVRIYTFTSNDGTGVPVDSAGLAYTINNDLSINSEVPPFLKFCVGQTITAYDCSTGNSGLLDFGELSTSTAKSAIHDMVFATNAGFGLGITYSGQTLTSGNNTIPAMLGATPPNTGQSQFGFNLRANSNPGAGSDMVGPGTGATSIAANYNQVNRYTFNSGDTIATTLGPADNVKLTASYVVNISSQQRPGIYNTTILYNCLANF